MATKFYPQAQSAGLDIPWPLTLTPGTSANAITQNTVLGPTSGVPFDSNGDGTGTTITWITKTLQAVTISGTVTFNIWMSENNMSANVGPHVLLERTDFFGNVLSTISNSEKGTEVIVGPPDAVNNWTATPTSTSLAAGDRIRAKIMGNDVGTMAAAFTFHFGLSGPTAAAAGDSWIQFTEAITEQVSLAHPPYRQTARIYNF